MWRWPKRICRRRAPISPPRALRCFRVSRSPAAEACRIRRCRQLFSRSVEPAPPSRLRRTSPSRFSITGNCARSEMRRWPANASCWQPTVQRSSPRWSTWRKRSRPWSTSGPSKNSRGATSMRANARSRAPGLTVSCVTFLLFAGCQQAPSAPQAPSPAAEKKEAGNPTAEAEGVTLKPEEIEKAGIKTTPAAASRHAPEVGGYALVIMREAIAQAVADLSTAAAMEHQSRAALARSRSLAGTPGAMAVEAQEAAERQATVDQASLQLAERKLSALYGRNA